MIELSAHPDVEFDYEAALRWYLARSPKTAKRFAESVARTLKLVATNPQLYPPLDDHHRFARLKRFPYLVVYRQDGNRVRLIAIAHSRRSSGFWKKRD